MNIYKVSQHDNRSKKAVKCFLVYARSEEEAALVNPDRQGEEWCYSPKNITVTYVGNRTNGPAGRIIMRSFEDHY